MRPAREGDIPVRVKNSYNPNAPGTLITRARDMSKVCVRISYLIFLWTQLNHINLSFLLFQAVLTSIVLKRNVTMLDIVSTRMLGQYGFLAKVRGLKFDFEALGLSGLSVVNLYKTFCSIRYFRSLKIWAYQWML